MTALTPSQQLDNLIRWRVRPASGKWKKNDGGYGSGVNRCAVGVACSVWRIYPLKSSPPLRELTGLDCVALNRIPDLNDDNPGDRFAAVIEYLNEHITRRKVALGLPVAADALVLAEVGG